MLAESVARGSPPHVGTRAFGADDDHIFFGRTREIEELSERWRRHRLTVLHGAAGVGKTSLVNAGVVPRLRGRGDHVLAPGLIWRRNVFPAAAFPEQNLFTLALLASWYPDASPAGVAGLSVLSALRRHGAEARFGMPVRTFAVIDQAELLFRRPMPHEDQRRRFLDELRQAVAAEPGLHLLLAGREEYLDEMLALGEELGGGACAEYPLRAFDHEAAMHAVLGPLAAGGESAREAAEALVEELRTVRSSWSATARRVPTVAPALLQPVCTRLWEERASQRPYETGAVAERLAVGVDEALREFCGQALAAIAADYGVSRSKLVSWFRETFAGGDNGGGIAEDRLAAEMPLAIVRALEDEHLVKVSVREGARTYELHHHRMIEPVRSLDERVGPVRRPEPPEQLRVAERALCVGELGRAQYGAEAVIRASGGGGLRLRAEAEQLLGNIAWERGLPELAARHYTDAAGLFDVLQDGSAVGLLLAARGLSLMAGRPFDAVRELRTAASRLPNDLVVHTALAQALWSAGQPTAALAVLDTVLAREGDTPEALRARGEMLIDLGRIESGWRDLSRIDHLGRPSTRAAWILAEAERGRAGRGRSAGAPETAGSSPTAMVGGGPEAAAPPPYEPLGTQAGTGGAEIGDPAELLGDATGNGPVLLRIARVRGLRGAEDAAVYAAQAMEAGSPPLPAHMKERARSLMRTGASAEE